MGPPEARVFKFVKIILYREGTIATLAPFLNLPLIVYIYSLVKKVATG